MDAADLARFVRRSATTVQATEKMLRMALTMRGLAHDTALWEVIDAYSWAVATQAMAVHRYDHACRAGLPTTPDLEPVEPTGPDNGD